MRKAIAQCFEMQASRRLIDCSYGHRKKKKRGLVKSKLVNEKGRTCMVKIKISIDK